MSWTADVVDTLCDLKRNGLSFDAAWSMTLGLHPPRGRDLGEYRPTLIPREGDEESVVEAFRRFCEDAWNGRRPSLRHFSAEVMRDAILDSTDAGSASTGRSRPPAFAT